MFVARRYLINAANPSTRGLATLSVEKFGAPTKSLKYDANPAEAKAPTADQVSVKVALANVSVEDIRKIRGVSLNSTRPGVAGTTAVGRIVGSGELVFVTNAASWADTITVARKKVHTITDLTPEEAAALPVFITAYALLKYSQAVAGDSILQTESESAVGEALIQLAKAQNIHVISVSTAELADPKAVEILKSKGVIKAAVSGSSGKHIHALTKVIAEHGKVLLHNGVYQSLDNVTGVELPIGRSIFQGVRIQGFDYIGWARRAPKLFQESLESVLSLAHSKKISLKPTIYEAKDYLKAISEVEKTGKFSVLKF